MKTSMKWAVAAMLVVTMGGCTQETADSDEVTEQELSATAQVVNLVKHVDRAQMVLTLDPGKAEQDGFKVSWARPGGGSPQITVKLDTANTTPANQPRKEFNYLLFHADDYVGLGYGILPEMRLQNVYWKCDDEHFDFRLYGDDNQGWIHGGLRWAAELGIKKFAAPDLRACNAVNYLRTFANSGGTANGGSNGNGFPAFTNIFNQFAKNTKQVDFSFRADTASFERAGSIQVPVVNQTLTGKIRLEAGQFKFDGSFQNPQRPTIRSVSFGLTNGITAGATNGSGAITNGVKLLSFSLERSGASVRLVIGYSVVAGGNAAASGKVALVVKKNAAGKPEIDVAASQAATSDPLIKGGYELLKIPFVAQGIQIALNAAFSMNALPQGRSLGDWLGL